MKPTRAQIEAAMNALIEMDIKKETGGTAISWYEFAQAALTAAAKVGDNWERSADGKETIRESRQSLEAEIERLRVQIIERDSAIAGWIKRTAAAEVGEGLTEYEIALANAHYKRGQADMKERCARVAEQYGPKKFSEPIAAAIRTLEG